MVFQEVLETAFSGCGWRSEETSWPKFRDLAQERTAALSRLSGAAAELRKAGALACSLALARLPLDVSLEELAAAAAEEPSCGTEDSVLLLQVLQLGQALCEAAYRKLPRTFIRPSGYDDMEVSLDLPLSLGALTAMWSASKPGAQHEIATLLAQTFAPKYDRDGKPLQITRKEDRADQGVERVLPELFGVWDPTLGWNNRPNCAGKAELVAAYGGRAGARMYAVSPLRFAATVMIETREKVARIIGDCMQKLGIPLSQARADSLKTVLSSGEQERNLPLGQHLALLLQRSDGSWVLVDPNMGLASVAPESWEMPLVDSKLQELSKIHPGAAVLRRDESFERLYDRQLSRLQTAAAKVEASWRTFQNASSWAELFSFFTASPLLPEMRAWSSDAQAEDAPADALWLFLSIIREAGDAPGLVRFFDRKTVRQVGAEGVFPYLPEDYVREAAATLCWRFLSESDNKLRQLNRMLRLEGKLVHPAVQISRVDAALGFAVLAHVALHTSQSASDSVEQTLLPLGLDFQRVFNVASSPLRPSDIPPEASSEAALVIERAPIRSYSSELLLRRLRGGSQM